MLLAATAGLLALGDLAARLEAALALLAVGFAALTWCAVRAEASRGEEAEGEGARRRVGLLVLGGAAVLRLLLLPLPPTLSDDVLRYVWDGRVVAAGENPYLLPPEAPELAPLRDDLWQRLPHKEVPTVYPPLALALFAAAAALPAPVLALKAALAGFDLVTCALLLALARRLGVPETRVLWYAWNPLVVLEVAGMGHVDALGVAGAVAAVAALLAARPVWAGLAAAGGALAKLAPLAALPAWTRAAGRRRRFAAVALGGVLAGLVPVVWATGGAPPGLVTYGVSWEFNGPLFEPLWRLLDAVGADAWSARVVDRLKAWSGHHEMWNRVYPYLYAQFLAKVVLGLGMLAVVVRSWRDRRPASATGRLFGGLLVLSATVYPWYLLWVLPFAALARHTGWLALSALALVSYLPQYREVALWPWPFLTVWLPFAALCLTGRRWSTA